MAETLTYENTQEATTIDNLNAEEQESLKVGEAMEEAQDNLLAGKSKMLKSWRKLMSNSRKNLEKASEPSGDN